jgi:hypothetical protein
MKVVFSQVPSPGWLIRDESRKILCIQMHGLLATLWKSTYRSSWRENQASVADWIAFTFQARIRQCFIASHQLKKRGSTYGRHENLRTITVYLQSYIRRGLPQLPEGRFRCASTPVREMIHENDCASPADRQFAQSSTHRLQNIFTCKVTYTHIQHTG